MTKFYDSIMAPFEARWLGKRRELLMAYAAGNVLEIGFGTGANLKYFNPEKINTLTALDVDQQKATRHSASFKFTYVTGHSENLPFEDESFDTVVETLVFCSVSDLAASVSEVMRVLKPGGRFIFMDHVLPKNKLLAAVFKRINIVWPHIAHGCQLTRESHLEIGKYKLEVMTSGTFAKEIFRYGVVEKPLDGQ